MSRRAQKKVSTYSSGSWSLTSTTTYIYDGWNLIREVSNPTSDLGPQTSVFYVWGLDLSGSLQGAGGIGGLLARVKDGVVQSYTYDGNGNVSELVDGTGNVVSHYEYDPYGNAIAPIVSDNPFRFSTKYLDAETGLYYYGYRWYSTQLGRWLSRDPIKEQGGFNLYGFAGNNPVDEIDPLGLVLVAVDGTDSSKWVRELPNSSITNSHVRNFHNDYLLEKDEKKKYWFGPDLSYTGYDAIFIHKKVVEYLSEIICENECEKINMVGFSRGGYIMMEVAREIGTVGISCSGKRVYPRVNFLGLYEPVDMVWGYGESWKAPSTADYVALAFNSSNSRSFFNKADKGSGLMVDDMVFAQWYFNTTHSGIGGDPGKGDHPKGLTFDQEKKGSDAADAFIRANARRAGIKFK